MTFQWHALNIVTMASGAEMLKKDAANSSAPSMKAAWRGYIFPGLSCWDFLWMSWDDSEHSMMLPYLIAILLLSGELWWTLRVTRLKLEYLEWLFRLRRVWIWVVVLVQFPTSEGNLHRSLAVGMELNTTLPASTTPSVPVANRAPNFAGVSDSPAASCHQLSPNCYQCPQNCQRHPTSINIQPIFNPKTS